MRCAWLEAQVFGGLVLNVNELEGALAGSGAELASNWMAEAVEAGGDNLEAAALGIERHGDGYVVTSDMGRHGARAVIVASGASLKKLGVPGETELEYKGVSHCADCDGPMFQGQEVVVVGGGDSALQSAMVLSNYCEAVHLIHRRDTFRAHPHWVEAVKGAGNVHVHFNSQVSALFGTAGLEGAMVNGEVIPCTGFFAFVGLQPSSDFLPEEIELDERGAVKASRSLETAMPGVFAAGAVRAGCGGTLEDAVADGLTAARAAVAKLAD